MPRYNFVAKNILLTYPQTDGDKESLLEFLKEKVPDANYIVVSKERHEDGNPHFHAVIAGSRRIHLRDPRFFDWTSNHPNVQATRSLPQSIAYVKKDGDCIEHGIEPVTAIQRRNNRSSRMVGSEVSAITTRAELFAYVLERDPRDYIFCHDSLCRYADRVFSEEIPYNSDFEFDPSKLPATLLQWKEANLDASPRRPKSLLLVGPSRTGKTEWARSLGKHIYCNTYLNAREIADKAEKSLYIVVDDIPYKSFFALKALIGCQLEFTLTDKYMKKMVIRNWGKPTIWVVNPDMDPRKDMEDNILCWFRLNCICLEIHSDLF